MAGKLAAGVCEGPDTGTTSRVFFGGVGARVRAANDDRRGTVRPEHHLSAAITEERAWAELVAREVAKLPARHASAIRLVYNHAMSHAEAGAWLGIAADDVTLLVADALQRLAPEVLRAP